MSGDLKSSDNRADPAIRNGHTTDPRVVSVDCKPAPDVEDRLRRLFTLLLRHAAREREASSQRDKGPDR